MPEGVKIGEMYPPRWYDESNPGGRGVFSPLYLNISCLPARKVTAVPSRVSPTSGLDHCCTLTSASGRDSPGFIRGGAYVTARPPPGSTCNGTLMPRSLSRSSHREPASMLSGTF